MRITHGRYVLTSKDQIERALAKQRAENAIQQAQLNMVGQWAREQLKLHQPYTQHLDVSCADPEEMLDDLVEKLKRNIWCARCSNPWPCPHIANLQLLREISRRNDTGTLADLDMKLASMPTRDPRKGQLDVGL